MKVYDKNGNEKELVEKSDIDEINNYSTEEVEVGTWFGEKLYRKTYKFENCNIENGKEFLLSSYFINANKIVSLYGYILQVNSAYVQNGRYAHIYVANLNKLYLYQEMSNNFTNVDVYVTVEYVR